MIHLSLLLIRVGRKIFVLRFGRIRFRIGTNPSLNWAQPNVQKTNSGHELSNCRMQLNHYCWKSGTEIDDYNCSSWMDWPSRAQISSRPDDVNSRSLVAGRVSRRRYKYVTDIYDYVQGGPLCAVSRENRDHHLR